MEKETAWVDGWHVRQRPDGSYGVYDSHGLLAGPFGDERSALQAALGLPHPAGHKVRVGSNSHASESGK
jgi:hypothetical protein